MHDKSEKSSWLSVVLYVIMCVWQNRKKIIHTYVHTYPCVFVDLCTYTSTKRILVYVQMCISIINNRNESKRRKKMLFMIWTEWNIMREDSDRGRDNRCLNETTSTQILISSAFYCTEFTQNQKSTSPIYLAFIIIYCSWHASVRISKTSDFIRQKLSNIKRYIVLHTLWILWRV